ncbi:hypothetical protein [Natranaerofaba carboxydovora]|uniref:hypothetical protein n=1 Tax=Natranaerofaba carboxydovora TaxID=2742683 RepID=UPI001F1422A4|nr:hypothetical protein [Natranaerofaba carboxydovora]
MMEIQDQLEMPSPSYRSSDLIPLKEKLEISEGEYTLSYLIYSEDEAVDSDQANITDSVDEIIQKNENVFHLWLEISK